MKYLKHLFTKKERRLKFSYDEFIKSIWWTKQKELWYSRHKKRCAKCKATENIHLHHKVYPKDGRYLNLIDNAFTALCSKCHYKFHKTNKLSSNMQKSTNRFIKKD